MYEVSFGVATDQQEGDYKNSDHLEFTWGDHFGCRGEQLQKLKGFSDGDPSDEFQKIDVFRTLQLDKLSS